MKILVLNGPNLNLLGTREPDVYGSETLAQIVARVDARAVELGVDVTAHQSNDEGALVSLIGACPGQYDGIIFNPAAYTHTGVALCHALRAVQVPCVEVHISNTHRREDFRHRSLTAAACLGQIVGFGSDGYLLALEGLVAHLRRQAEGGAVA